jgi:hypothetical protein
VCAGLDITVKDKNVVRVLLLRFLVVWKLGRALPAMAHICLQSVN